MIILAEFEFALGTYSKIIYQSLLPELWEEYQRSRSTLILEQDILILKVEADDIVSMRAALNGWLRLIKISCEMSSMHKL
jgi:KEOPS complex subunit Pcc1